MARSRILVYLLRRDLRFADNPIFSEVFKTQQQSQQPYTHFLPLYVFPAQQVEVSGFLASESDRSPFPESRSDVAGFWRCGPHRTKFLAESVWDLKSSLEDVGNGLHIRVGMVGQVIQELLEAFHDDPGKHGEIISVWMTGEEGVEEKREEDSVRSAVESAGKDFRLWADEKYFIDDRDIPYHRPIDLPDVFTSFRNQVEPLREAPRKTLPTPKQLPPFPLTIPKQPGPFAIPHSLGGIISCLDKPLQSDLGISHPPKWPNGAKSAHPFCGGETSGHERIKHLIDSGSMSNYKDTRNGMLGLDFSTKLSAWLALGCITSRQIHEYLVNFETGKTELGKGARGYGRGENKGTAAVRFELLWRDYMRLCTRKFGPRLFRIEGFRNDASYPWKHPSKDRDVQQKIDRFISGTTGTGLIDASMRELFLTGYTSNRARQNVASFLAKHLGIDWRVGAEWYESQLVDYDVSSNWGNWQYTSGVGNDPRGEARVFNPVKQAHDYDPQGEYVKNWVEELRPLDDPQVVFQAWKVPEDKKREVGLQGLQWVEDPLKRIQFNVGRGRGRGAIRGNGGKGGKAGGSRGGGGGGGGGGGFQGRAREEKIRGRGRMGHMDKAHANGAFST